MDTPLLVGIVLIVVVAFFAWQWWSATGRKTLGGGRKANSAAGLVGAAMAANVGSGGPTPASEMAPLTTAPPKEEKYPVVAGQSEAELRAKEPVQERKAPVSEMPVTPDNLGPATIPDTLRHPEQSFHQPTAKAPTMMVSDVPAGRAGTPGLAVPPAATGGAQMFAPEMAQNGGPVIGNSVFAFDGMEPTGFASF